VQYSFVMQLVQMRSNLGKWGVEHSRTLNLCKQGTRVKLSTMFIC